MLVGGAASASSEGTSQSADDLIPITKETLNEHKKRVQIAMDKGKAKLNGKHSVSEVVTFQILPVWFRRRPGGLYTPSEPEGKDFIRIQEDLKKRDQLQKDIGRWTKERVKSHIAKLPSVHPTKVDIRFIPGPRPPRWEVPMLCWLKDGSPAFGWITLPPERGARLEHILRPKATFDAAKASVQAFCHVIYIAVATHWNGGSVDDILHRHASKARGYRLAEQQSKDLSNQIQWPNLDQFWKPPDSNQSAKTVHYGLLRSIPFSAAVAFAGATFRERQMAALEQHKKSTTRGIMHLLGTVTFYTSIGNLIVHVNVDYSPSEDCFIGRPAITSAIMQYNYVALGKIEQKKKEIEQGKRALQQRQLQLLSPPSHQQGKQEGTQESEPIEKDIAADKEKD